jgi:hypothetical protein
LRVTSGSLHLADELVGVGNRGIHVVNQLCNIRLDVGRFAFQRSNGLSVQVVFEIAASIFAAFIDLELYAPRKPSPSKHWSRKTGSDKLLNC